MFQAIFIVDVIRIGYAIGRLVLAIFFYEAVWSDKPGVKLAHLSAFGQINFECLSITATFMREDSYGISGRGCKSPVLVNDDRLIITQHYCVNILLISRHFDC